MNKSQGLLVLYGGTQAWFHTGTVSFQDYKQEIRSLVPGHPRSVYLTISL